jgi:hypothetical protein
MIGINQIRLASAALGVVSACLFGGCYCPGGNCDSAFRPNYEARHRVFVENLNAWIGRPFNHTCLSEGNCGPQVVESGLIRYTAIDWRPWMKGCRLRPTLRNAAPRLPPARARAIVIQRRIVACERG